MSWLADKDKFFDEVGENDGVDDDRGYNCSESQVKSMNVDE